MSKIAEQKALEEYPVTDENKHDIKTNAKRVGYREGYGQAMKDFMEKAEKFFNEELYVSISDQICSVDEFSAMSNFIEQFKNYVQNESEN